MTAMAPDYVLPNNAAPIKLTKKENQVLLLIREGLSSKEAADSMDISKRTVDFHLSNIYFKLNVRNRFRAVKQAQILGLI